MYSLPFCPSSRAISAIRGQITNGIRQSVRVLRFDRKPGAGFLKNRARLPLDAEDDGARARHEFQHLGGDDRLEHVGFLEQNQANIRRADVGGNFLARLLIDESQIVQTALARQRGDAVFFGAFAHHQKNNLGICILQLGRRLR